MQGLKKRIKYCFKKLNYNRILLHILFWIVLLSVYNLLTHVGRHSIDLDLYGLSIIGIIYTVLPLLLINYAIIYYFFPIVAVKNKQIVLFAIISIIGILIVDLIEILIQANLFLPKYLPDYVSNYKAYAFTPRYVLINFYNKSSIIIIFFAIKFFKDYVLVYHENERLKQEKNKKQIQLLKKNLHPSLLFNSLENINHLNNSENVDDAAESVALLSDILRYSLYNNEEIVKLEVELSAIYKFIKLVKLSYPSIAIEILIRRNIETIQIQHLLLFNVIEKLIEAVISKSKSKELILSFDALNDELLLNVTSEANPELLELLNNDFSRQIDILHEGGIMDISTNISDENLFANLIIRSSY